MRRSCQRELTDEVCGRVVLFSSHFGEFVPLHTSRNYTSSAPSGHLLLKEKAYHTKEVIIMSEANLYTFENPEYRKTF